MKGVTTWALSRPEAQRNCVTGENTGYPRLDRKTPEPLLQLEVGVRLWMRRIGGRLGSCPSGGSGAALEIPPFHNLISNPPQSSCGGTASGGQFDWGGRLLKSNGGAQRLAQAV